MPTLFQIPTVLAPDTSSAVLSPQISEVLKQTKYFFVEEVRTSRRFISELRLGIVIDELVFFELTKKTPPDETKKQLLEIQQLNVDCGVISEAGCPGVADPGAVAASLAHQLDFKVVPLVGPSSILLALMASGMNGQSFAFLGYLPINRADRQHGIRHLEQEAKRKKQSQIFMETPFRNNQMLADLLMILNPETLLCIAVDITAKTESIMTKPVKDWKKLKIDLHKRPCIFIV